MIGVQAVSGGLMVMFFLSAIAVVGMCGLFAGVALIAAGRRRVGALCMTASTLPLLFIARLAWPMLFPPVHDIALDLRQPSTFWREKPFTCQEVQRETWCSVSDVSNLKAILPDGQILALKGRNLHSVVDERGVLKRIAFSVFPEPEGSGLLALLDDEIARSARGAAVPQGESTQLRQIARLKRIVESNSALATDEHVDFRRGEYTVDLWLLPRSASEGYFIWYQVFPTANRP